MKKYRIACDMGGTFTDLMLFNMENKEMKLVKVPSDPKNPQNAVLNGIEKLNVDFLEVDFIGHGSTIALNTLIQKKGSKTGLITTRGFKDILEIQRFNRPDMYNLNYEKPEPLVPRNWRLEVDERVEWDGTVSRKLDLQELDDQVQALLVQDVTAIAICFINAYINSANEEMAYKYLRSQYPSLYVTASYQMSREWREYERSSTAVINAYLQPSVRDYLATLEAEMLQRSYKKQLLITKNDGGLMSAGVAKERPVSMISSGPAGGVLGAEYYARLTGKNNIITLDMGGTSTDVSLIENGQAKIGRTFEIDRYPILESFTDIYSIGAGGGTVAWIDDAGMLKMGPHSSGAIPGPVCYQKGGTEPTVTDANVILGRIDPKYFLGGEMVLDRDGAESAFHKLAEPLQMNIQECATGCLEIINAAMVNAIRVVSIEKGYDPRDFDLIVFGGAGALHGALLASDLGIPRVIIPKNPSHMAPWGILVANIKHQLSRTFIASISSLAMKDLELVLEELRDEAVEMLQHEEIEEERMQIHFALDMRYEGQEHTVTVPFNCNNGLNAVQQSRQEFDSEHERLYSFSLPAAECQIVNVRCEATGEMKGPELKEIDTAVVQGDALKGYRDVYIDRNQGFILCPIYDRNKIVPTQKIEGPAVIEEATSTVMLFNGQTVSMDNYGNLYIETVSSAD